MALFPDKFTIIKQTIPTHPQQAREECDNAINNECVNAKGDFLNIKNKLLEKYPGEELVSADLLGAITNYFGEEAP